YSEVVEEEDDQSWPSSEPAAQPPAAGERAIDAFEPLLQTISRRAANADEEEQQREAAELLHAMGTAEALRRLGSRPGHASARALLRDSRWESAGAGRFPARNAKQRARGRVTGTRAKTSQRFGGPHRVQQLGGLPLLLFFVGVGGAARDRLQERFERIDRPFARRRRLRRRLA